MASRNIALLNLSLALVIAAAAGVGSMSGSDSDARILRYGLVLMTAGAAFWLPWPALVLVVPTIWLGPNYLRGELGGAPAFTSTNWLELPVLLFLAGGVAFVRHNQRLLEDGTMALEGYTALKSEVDEETGAYQERLLKESIERELARSRRFGREFALMLADIDPLRIKFDYRGEAEWEAALEATAGILLQTRTHVDRVYRYGEHAFALLLPETGPKDVTGLLRRLARAAKKAPTPEGEPGGPLALHFGVTFFPQCATTVDDLLRRAEVALRIAEGNVNRVQLDGAEAPGLLPPELLRKQEEDEVPVDSPAGKWSGAEAREEGEIWETTSAAVTDARPAFGGTEFQPTVTAPVQTGVGSGQPDTESVSGHGGADNAVSPAVRGGKDEEATSGADMADELGALLGRMNETLSMIRDVRAATAV